MSGVKKLDKVRLQKQITFLKALCLVRSDPILDGHYFQFFFCFCFLFYSCSRLAPVLKTFFIKCFSSSLFQVLVANLLLMAQF